MCSSISPQDSTPELRSLKVRRTLIPGIHIISDRLTCWKPLYNENNIVCIIVLPRPILTETIN